MNHKGPRWTAVAIPLGQGQVFNAMTIGVLSCLPWSQSLWVRDRFLMINSLQAYWPQGVAIPLGQGQVFNIAMIGGAPYLMGSQSLWVRDRFLINLQSICHRLTYVAIPLGQGQVSNKSDIQSHLNRECRNPFG